MTWQRRRSDVRQRSFRSQRSLPPLSSVSVSGDEEEEEEEEDDADDADGTACSCLTVTDLSCRATDADDML